MAWKATLLHVVEIVVCLAAAWVVLTFFGVDDGMKKDIAGIVLAAIAKFARSSEDIPLPDYVNRS